MLVAAFSLRSPQCFSEMVLCTIEESHGLDNDNRCSFHQHSHHVDRLCQLHSNMKSSYFSPTKIAHNTEVYFTRNVSISFTNEICRWRLNWQYQWCCFWLSLRLWKTHLNAFQEINTVKEYAYWWVFSTYTVYTLHICRPSRDSTTALIFFSDSDKPCELRTITISN